MYQQLQVQNVIIRFAAAVMSSPLCLDPICVGGEVDLKFEGMHVSELHKPREDSSA